MILSPKSDLLLKLKDSMTIIRGNAQLAQKVDHGRWTHKYLKKIIREIDRVSALLKEIESLDEECFSKRCQQRGSLHQANR